MGWVRIDDHFDEHPKMANISLAGMGLWLAGLAYSNRNLTDGFIPWSIAQRLGDTRIVTDDGAMWELAATSGMGGQDLTNQWIINLLLDAGLWEEESNGGGRVTGYRIHDYEDYQPSRQDVLVERERNAERQRRHRERNAIRDVDVTPVVTDMSQDRSDGPNPNPNPESNPEELTEAAGEGCGEGERRAWDTVRRLGVSEPCFRKSLEVFPELRGRDLVTPALTFEAHYANAPPKNADKAWLNWQSKQQEITHERPGRPAGSGRAATHPGRASRRYADEGEGIQHEGYVRERTGGDRGP